MTRAELRARLLDAEELVMGVLPTFSIEGYMPKGGDGEVDLAELEKGQRGLRRAQEVLDNNKRRS